VAEQYDVVVVGGGHNGLAAAATIAKHGFRVAVCERRQFPGGAVATEELYPGYRFSSCSYITHMLHERVVEELGIATHLGPIHSLGPEIHLLPDGRVFRREERHEDTAITAGRLFGAAAADACLTWDKRWDEAGRFIDEFLLGPAPTLGQLDEHSASLPCADTIRVFGQLSYRQLLDQTLPELMRTAFAPNLDGSIDTVGSPLTQAYYATERCRRTYQGVPEGGMGAVSQAFAAAARALGVDVLLGREVAEIVIQDGVATGVRLTGGERIDADAIVSNADPKRTFLKLIDAHALPRGLADQIGGLDSSPGGVKIHLALRRKPDMRKILGDRDPKQLGLINLYPSWDWYVRAPIQQRRGSFPRDAFPQIQIPTFADETLAAPGRHIMSIFIPHVAPRLSRRGWASRRWDLANLTLKRIAEVIPNLWECLDGVVVFSPEELEQRVGLTDGNIRHIAHLPGQAYANRPMPDWSDGTTPISRLYLCGASVHPGGEVSGVPGYRVGTRVANELGSHTDHLVGQPSGG
jgi:phytoene dehydrogenase-like protein